MASQLLQVTYAKRLKRVQLQRALVSLIVHFPERTTPQMLLVLVDNLLWLQDKAYHDPDFAKKFGVTLKVLAYILKHKFGNQQFARFSKTRIKYLSNALRENLEGSFVFPERNTLNQYKLVAGLFSVRQAKSLGTPVKQLPPQGYIGKGYRDKGTAKNTAEDGSPSWQEIASLPFGRIS